MRVKIKIRFRDKDDYGRVYEQNEVHEFQPARALELVKLGLVEQLSDQPTKPAYVAPKVEIPFEPEHTEEAEQPAEVEEPVKVVAPNKVPRGRKAKK